MNFQTVKHKMKLTIKDQHGIRTPLESKMENKNYHSILIRKADRTSIYDSPSTKYLLSLQSEQSKTTMLSHLNKVAAYFGIDNHHEFYWESLTSDVVYLLRSKLLEENLAPSTINTAMNAVKKTCEFAFISRLMTHEEYARVKLVDRVKGKRVRSQRELTKDEIQTFIKGCQDGTYMGLRDLSIFLLMVGCGLRRGELVNVQLKDIDLDSKKILIKGKGNKHRSNWMPQLTIDCIKEYIEELHTNSSPEDYLFVRFFKHDEPLDHVVIGKDGKAKEMKLALSSVNHILKQRGGLASVVKFKPHDLRGTYATKMLRDGKEISVVCLLLGHSSIETTRVYDLRKDEEAKSSALSHEIF
jgi:integrase/recombinase XerD